MKLKIMLVLILILLAPPVHATIDPVHSDPLETFNRAMFSFNRGVLEYVINPAVDFFAPRLPSALITAAHNVYSNLTEIEFILNGLLVGDLKSAADSSGRFGINLTLGVGGIFDVASYFGLQRVERDFIASLCQTGLPPGPYMVFPLVGPGNLYSATALVTGVAVEVYFLSFISTTLALADFIIIDVGGTAAALRYMRNLPFDTNDDPYFVQKNEHMNYVQQVCTPPSVAKK